MAEVFRITLNGLDDMDMTSCDRDDFFFSLLFLSTEWTTGTAAAAAWLGDDMRFLMTIFVTIVLYEAVSSMMML